MQKVILIEILLLVLLMYFKYGDSLKCFICRSDTDSDCGGSVDLNYSKECKPKSGSEVYCRKISQILKFKSEKNPTFIRECAYEKQGSSCYRFIWTSIAKQQTCECQEENCNRGITNIPCILTIVLVPSLTWIYVLIKRDHT